MKLNHVIFYGTLMQKCGGRGVIDRLIKAGHIELVRDIEFSGKLYNMGAYPALLMGEDTVQGELFKITDKGLEDNVNVLEETFDVIEGYHGDKDRDLYTRTLMCVPDDDILAWTYTYNGIPGDVIPSGDWHEFTNQ